MKLTVKDMVDILEYLNAERAKMETDIDKSEKGTPSRANLGRELNKIYGLISRLEAHEI